MPHALSKSEFKLLTLFNKDEKFLPKNALIQHDLTIKPFELEGMVIQDFHG